MAETNEGKCCDAVINIIEKRENSQRSNISFPEKEKNHPAPVELVCKIGSLEYAFEHTLIEPIEDFIRIQREKERLFSPIELGVRNLPPSEYFHLNIPVDSLAHMNGEQLRNVQERIIAWIEDNLTSIPIAPYGRFLKTIVPTSLKNVPFSFTLYRFETTRLGGRLHVVLTTNSNDIEPARIAQIERRYNKKIDKLYKMSCLGKRTVLILEDNDIQLTNFNLVSKAVKKVEKNLIYKPDEVYLVSVLMPHYWSVSPIRINNKRYLESSDYINQPVELDPSTLTDLTN